MKIKFFISSLCLIGQITFVNAQDRSIQFEHGTWAEIKAKAAKENKTIFFDAFTSWCGPCKTLAAEVFTINEVADYFNTNFVNAKFDMEKGEGPELAKMYGVRAYPSLMFINADGKLINKREGALDFKVLLEVAKKSIGGESLEYLQTQYKNGNREYQFIKKYLSRMEGLRANIPMVVEDYFKNLDQSKWSAQENWYLIDRYVKSEESPIFKYLLANKSKFVTKFSSAAVTNYMLGVYRNSLTEAANSVFAIEDLKDEKARYKAMNFDAKDQLILECDAIIADISKDYKSYIDLMALKFVKYPETDKTKQLNWINEVCWKMLQKTSDPYVIQKAAELASVSIKYQMPAFMDTYAHLLAETGAFDRAIAIEEQILELIRKKPDTDLKITDIESTIQKFKRRKG